MRQLFQVAVAATMLSLAAMPAPRAQEDPTVYMVTYIEVAPASQTQGATLLKELAEASRKEAGAMRFEVLQRTAPSNQFLILEAWKDQQAIDAHANAASTKQVREKISAISIAPVDDRISVNTSVRPTQNARIGSGSIYVATHIDVGPPSRDKTIATLRPFAEAVRRQAGNQRFDVLQQKARTNHFTTVEVWEDQKAADNHELAAHTKEYRATLTPLIGALYDQRFYKPL
jgi:quinol monooxygenase YgiN